MFYHAEFGRDEYIQPATRAMNTLSETVVGGLTMNVTIAKHLLNLDQSTKTLSELEYDERARMARCHCSCGIERGEDRSPCVPHMNNAVGYLVSRANDRNQ